MGCCQSKTKESENEEAYSIRTNTITGVRDRQDNQNHQNIASLRSQAKQVRQPEEDTPPAAEDLSLEPLRVEAFDRSLPVLSRQSALAAEAVQLAVLPRAVVRRDGLADLISLEQTHGKYLVQAEEYKARATQNKTLMASEMDVLFGERHSLFYIQQTIRSSVTMTVIDKHADLSSSLLQVAATYRKLSDSFRFQAVNWVARRPVCHKLTTSHLGMRQLTIQCEKDDLLPLGNILKFPFDRVAKYLEIFPRLQQLAVDEGLDREADSLTETTNALTRVNDAVRTADDLSRKFGKMWKKTVVLHRVKKPSMNIHPMSLSHYATFKLEILPKDLSAYLEKTRKPWRDFDVHCFLFKRLLIALCVVDEKSRQFFSYLYPLSRVGVNSVHLNANAWSVCRYDNLEYCELILRSSSQADKWKTINLVRERARQNGCKTTKQEEAELTLTFDIATAGIRRQLHVLMKELVDTEETYVKVLDVLMTCYLLPLRAERLLSPQETDAVCCNLERLVSRQRVFLKALETALLETDDVRQILKLVCEAFRVNMDHFNIYGDYIVKLPEANHILAKRRSELENFLKKQRSSEVNALSLHSLWNFGLEDKCSKFDSLVTKQGPPGKRETSLHSLLTMPFQRLLRYPLVLKSVTDCIKSARASGWQEEVELLETTVDAMEGIAFEANARKKTKSSDRV